MAVQGIGTGAPVQTALQSENEAVKTALAAQSAPPDNTPAAIVQINNATFSQKLEQHISDYNAGVGYISQNTDNQLQTKGQNLASSLNPKSLSAYLGYTTAFSYDNKARFINGTADALGQLKKITG